MLLVNNIKLDTDPDGYLTNLNDWSPDAARAIAQSEGIELTEAHWEIIDVLKKFYDTYETSPSARPLAKAVKAALGAEKSSSIYLMNLFPESPAKQAAKIAGLPRPANCF